MCVGGITNKLHLDISSAKVCVLLVKSLALLICLLHKLLCKVQEGTVHLLNVLVWISFVVGFHMLWQFSIVFGMADILDPFCCFLESS